LYSPNFYLVSTLIRPIQSAPLASADTSYPIVAARRIFGQEAVVIVVRGVSWESSAAVVGFFFAGTGLLAMVLALLWWVGQI
jgi:hypothetical protein